MYICPTLCTLVHCGQLRPAALRLHLFTIEFVIFNYSLCVHYKSINCELLRGPLRIIALNLYTFKWIDDQF